MSSVFGFIKKILGKPEVSINKDLVAKVETLALQGKSSEAIEELDKFASNNYGTNNAQAREFSKHYILLMKSGIQTESGMAKEAIETLEKDVPTIEEVEHPVLTNLIHIELANAYQLTGDLNKSSEHIELGKETVEKLRFFYKPYFLKHRARIYNLEGKVLRKQGQFVEAIDSLETSLEIWNQVGNRFYKAETLNDIGIVHASMGDMEAGLNYLNECLTIYEELNNETQLLKIYNNAGVMNWQTSKLDAALDNFGNALEISKRRNLVQNTAIILLNTGLIYQDQGRISDAQHNFEESLKLFEEQGNQIYIAQCLMNLATIHGTFGDTDKGLELLNRALAIYEEAKIEDEVGLVYSNMSIMYRLKGQYDKSLELAEKSLEIHKHTGNMHFQLNALYKVIEICMTIGKVKEAEEYLPELEKLSHQLANKNAEHQFKISKARILLSSDRVVKRAEAQTLFGEVADDEVSQQQTTIEALLGLGELLLQELKLSASEEALNEFKALIDRLDKFSRSSEAQSLSQVPTMIQVLLLRSKLAIIDLNVDQAQKFLAEAHDLASKNSLNNLRKVVEDEQELIKNEMMKYKKMVDSNASLYERLQQTQIENYLQRAENILKKR